mmetsp:Transcript_100630/g.290670  ORF Transcript_100630/g.290670 Transcript_100630/m.290670 type:complete len:413 (+) Transcript_100630:28-1266(+)
MTPSAAASCIIPRWATRNPSLLSGRRRMMKLLCRAALLGVSAATCDYGEVCESGESLNLLQTYVRVVRGERHTGAKGRGEAADVAECLDGREIITDPAAVHAVWASNYGQAEGLKASIASAIDATSVPLVAHILVQKTLEADFQRFLGLAPGCRNARLGGRATLRLHEIDDALVARARPTMPAWVLRTRGQLDAIENYARFYMHKLIPGLKVAVYLDADTIIQSDLAQLREEFIASNRTIGFASRRRLHTMSKFLVRSHPCNFSTPEKWKKLLDMPAYNVGVYVVDVERWARLHLSERIEGIVRRHNACGGNLWRGGSQPPLLMALYIAKDGLAQDFHVFDAAWNVADLGWRTGLFHGELDSAKILHWNGRGKPWGPSGNYSPRWRPHRERYDILLRASRGRGSAADPAPII